VLDQLEAFIDFEEGSGTIAHDGTGNGHDATLVGGTSWGSGYAHVHNEGDMIRVETSSAMRGERFTYDIWFEANAYSLGGRLLHQAHHVGGEGPDILEWYGQKVSFRITKGAHAVFDSPLVGSLTTPAPPNHLAQCDESFHRNDGPEHLVFVHDGQAQWVKVFQGLEGQPLELVYDGSYSGNYSVSDEDLTLGNALSGDDRAHPSRFYTFAYYSKLLSYAVGGNGHVTGGEVLDMHLAGSSVTMGTDDPPDGGPGNEGDGGIGVVCDDLLATEHPNSLAYLDVEQGDPTTITFHITSVPDPAELDLATLSLQLDDADHPGVEGTVYVNGDGPLDLPADTSWNDQVKWAELAIPVAFLVEGTNTFAFGAGSGSRTYYGVGKLALTVEGPACEPEQEEPPIQDGGVDPPDEPEDPADPADPELAGEPATPDEHPQGLQGFVCTHAGGRSADRDLSLLAVLLGASGVLLTRRARRRKPS